MVLADEGTILFEGKDIRNDIGYRRGIGICRRLVVTRRI